MIINNARGFTLLELMIATGIFAIAMTAIYQTYNFQQRSYLTHEKMVDMQQNMRTGLYFLKSDLMMAGYDPSGLADATITTATASEIEFDVDVDGSQIVGDNAREIVRYALTNDADADGVADGFPCNLGREYNGGGGLQPVAENVEALEFCYVLEDGSETLAPADLDDVRAVFVSLLMKTGSKIRGYTNTDTYTPASNDASITPDFSGTRPGNWGPFGDGFKRQLAVTKIRCRNMGLNPFPD